MICGLPMFAEGTQVAWLISYLYSRSVHTFVNTKDVTLVAGDHTSWWYSGISTASLYNPEVDIKDHFCLPFPWNCSIPLDSNCTVKMLEQHITRNLIFQNKHEEFLQLVCLIFKILSAVGKK